MTDLNYEPKRMRHTLEDIGNLEYDGIENDTLKDEVIKINNLHKLMLRLCR